MRPCSGDRIAIINSQVTVPMGFCTGLPVQGYRAEPPREILKHEPFTDSAQQDRTGPLLQVRGNMEQHKVVSTVLSALYVRG